jgi:hypothetical protein
MLNPPKETDHREGITAVPWTVTPFAPIRSEPLSLYMVKLSPTELADGFQKRNLYRAVIDGADNAARKSGDQLITYPVLH